MADLGCTYAGFTDAEAFMREFEDTSNYKGLNAAKRQAAFSLCLKGAVKDWHDSLPQDIKNDWDRMKDRFLNVYKPRPELKWARERELYQRQQKVGEPVVSFISTLHREARALQLGEEQTINLIIGGLQPQIRSHVLDQHPHNLEELRESASRAETRLAGLQQELGSDIHNELKALSLKVDNLSIPISAKLNATTTRQIENQTDNSKLLGDLMIAMEQLPHKIANCISQSTSGTVTAIRAPNEGWRRHDDNGQPQAQRQYQTFEANDSQRRHYQPDGATRQPWLYRDGGQGRGRGRGQTVGRCFKCGMFGHIQRYCSAELCQLCGQANHTAINCPRFTSNNTNPFAAGGYQQSNVQNPN